MTGVLIVKHWICFEDEQIFQSNKTALRVGEMSAKIGAH